MPVKTFENLDDAEAMVKHVQGVNPHAYGDFKAVPFNGLFAVAYCEGEDRLYLCERPVKGFFEINL